MTAVVVAVLVGLAVRIARDGRPWRRAVDATSGRVRTHVRRSPSADGSRVSGVREPALVIDLVRACLAGGLPSSRALAAVATVCADGSAARGVTTALAAAEGPVTAGELSPGPPPPVPEALQPLVDALELAQRTGASIDVVLSQAAGASRRGTRDAATRAAGRLAAAMVLPLGLCALPGFLLLGIAPVVVRLMTSIG